jgi:hypothetical protein
LDGKFYKIEYALTGMIRRLKNKRGIEMSFQFIFSAILVAVVLFVGFFVIRMFLDVAEKGRLMTAIEDVRVKVDEVFDSEGSRQLMHFKLNSAVDYICFSNYSTCRQSDLGSNPDLSRFCSNISSFTTGENMFLYPLNSVSKYKVNSWAKIYCGDAQDKNCLDVSKAKCFRRGLDPRYPDEFSFYVEKPSSNSMVVVRAP